MSLSITISNQIKCYNLSSCPTLPQFLEDAYKTRKSLRQNELYRKRIEVIQSFDFPTSCTQVEETQDQQYIVSSGLYAPSVKIYETSQLSLKCLRGLDSDIVKFCLLQDDYKKIALATSDRNIELHAQYGKHYKTRVPKQPTDMLYNRFTCDLLVSSISDQLVRLSLDQGQFLSSIHFPNEEGINSIDHNLQLNVVYAGGMKYLNTLDYRSRELANQLKQDKAITSIVSHDLQVAAGYEDGQIKLFDVRQSVPLLTLQHQYRLPIKRIRFNEKFNILISADEKIMKFYQLNKNGALFTSKNSITLSYFKDIEPTTSINDFCQIKDSGVFMVAQEQPRVGMYFLPQLDNAPKWCPFLENLTEELEEEDSQVVYEDFKFITYETLEELDALHLLETKMVKQYLHGYLIHLKLYNKLALDKGFTYENHKQSIIDNTLANDMEQQKVSKGYLKEKKQDVNEEYKDELKTKKANKFSGEDQRFSSMFKDQNYRIDKQSDHWKRLHPSEIYKAQANFTKNDTNQLNHDMDLDIDVDELDQKAQKPMKFSSKKIQKKPNKKKNVQRKQ